MNRLNLPQDVVTKYNWAYKYYVAFSPSLPDHVGFGPTREDATQDLHLDPKGYQIAQLRYPFFFPISSN